eukprot:Platyproteum_vivax@DN5732_c0_g1_i1.p1
MTTIHEHKPIDPVFKKEFKLIKQMILEKLLDSNVDMSAQVADPENPSGGKSITVATKGVLERPKELGPHENIKKYLPSQGEASSYDGYQHMGQGLRGGLAGGRASSTNYYQPQVASDRNSSTKYYQKVPYQKPVESAQYPPESKRPASIWHSENGGFTRSKHSLHPHSRHPSGGVFSRGNLY